MEDIQFKKNYSALVNPNYSVASADRQPPKTGTAAGSEFGRIFQQTLQNTPQLTFSKHALQRLDSRQIQVSPQLLSKISSAVEKAGSKGIRDALILNGQTAFIVNIPSKTVVTTMSGQEMAENVFTNIDGAVLI
ncbi:MAG TPA: TIGR02530 family flagellar biosynthesis protein [Caproiciproducens sp.]|nr:TIGR02530 family flagellar biosynthesis protein [Caproiciproducens sp.]